MYYMATQVDSWRVPTELKSKLEQQARLWKTSVASVSNTAAREWLEKSTVSDSDEETQRRLHEEARKSFGVFSSHGGPYTNQKVREVNREKFRGRYGK